ncbi:MAG: hypothetical protein KAU62_09760 [Candidatus Heimdallarchaeota archaeon]|nr:hypothetical protein [Candidatus Heimdallarchaeota archaeon]MCK4611427.1 hypothetical protein [Candidatus Heimdallarchaeota archaeon]
MSKERVSGYTTKDRKKTVRDYDRKAKKKGKKTKKTGKRTYKKYADSEKVNKAEKTAGEVPDVRVQAGVSAKQEADRRIDET